MFLFSFYTQSFDEKSYLLENNPIIGTVIWSILVFPLFELNLDLGSTALKLGLDLILASSGLECFLSEYMELSPCTWPVL